MDEMVRFILDSDVDTDLRDGFSDENDLETYWESEV